MTDEAVRVLLIEDNPTDVRLIRELLAEAGEEALHLECADRLSAGLERLAEGRVDVVLLDLGLPDSQGLDTFVKVHDKARELPIVVLTVLEDEELAVEAMRKGAQDYLVKARVVDGEMLSRAIRYAIERRRADEEMKDTLETLQTTMGGLVKAMALTVEARDPSAAGHQRRVSQLALAIAEEMGFSEEQVNVVYIAAVIHDIGKISIPAEILSKRGQLSETELGMVKSHPQVGYDILKRVEFPWPVAPIVLQHHERMDGSGYPQGLSGEEILLEARILGVADVVETMSFNPPQQGALGLHKALEEISQKKGLLYDPKVADACLKLFNEKGFSFE